MADQDVKAERPDEAAEGTGAHPENPSPVLEACFRHRGALLVLTGAPIAAAALSEARWLPVPVEIALGGLLMSLGVLTRILACRWIGKRARVGRSGAAYLLCQGPYAHTRNPLYVANVLIAGGSCVASGLGPWAFAVVGYVLLVYTIVITAEERSLREIFGERYDVFKARVPRWLPRITAADPVDEATVPQWSWGEVLRRESPMMFGVAVALAALGYVRAGGPGVSLLAGVVDRLAGIVHVERPVMLAAIVVVVAACEALATHLKRRRHAIGRALERAAALERERVERERLEREKPPVAEKP